MRALGGGAPSGAAHRVSIFQTRRHENKKIEGREMRTASPKALSLPAHAPEQNCLLCRPLDPRSGTEHGQRGTGGEVEGGGKRWEEGNGTV